MKKRSFVSEMGLHGCSFVYESGSSVHKLIFTFLQSYVDSHFARTHLLRPLALQYNSSLVTQKVPFIWKDL